MRLKGGGILEGGRGKCQKGFAYANAFSSSLFRLSFLPLSPQAKVKACLAKVNEAGYAKMGINYVFGCTNNYAENRSLIQWPLS